MKRIACIVMVFLCVFAGSTASASEDLLYQHTSLFGVELGFCAGGSAGTYDYYYDYYDEYGSDGGVLFGLTWRSFGAGNRLGFGLGFYITEAAPILLDGSLLYRIPFANRFMVNFGGGLTAGMDNYDELLVGANLKAGLDFFLNDTVALNVNTAVWITGDPIFGMGFGVSFSFGGGSSPRPSGITTVTTTHTGGGSTRPSRDDGQNMGK